MRAHVHTIGNERSDRWKLSSYREAGHGAAFDRKDDCELRRGDVARRIDPGPERANNCGATFAGENILNLERHGIRQCADITNKIGHSLTPQLMADPRERSIISLDLEHEIIVE